MPVSRSFREMTANIVPITPELAAGYREALDVVAKERKFLRLLEAPPLERSLAFVSKNIAEGNPQFVAVLNGSVVGWCAICRSNDPWSTHMGTLGMGIVPSYRGMGIGKALITATIRDARRQGFHRVELEVWANNVNAITLYEKVGFQHEGRLRDAMLLDGGYRDLLVMGLIFE